MNLAVNSGPNSRSLESTECSSVFESGPLSHHEPPKSTAPISPTRPCRLTFAPPQHHAAFARELVAASASSCGVL
jgi:hypothetical protein